LLGDWGLGMGNGAQSPIPNPQSPIPNPHKIILIYKYYFINKLVKIKRNIEINKELLK